MNTSAHPSATCGNTQGSAYVHTRESIAAGLARSRVALPASLTGKGVILADFPDLPPSSGQAPVVVFLMYKLDSNRNSIVCTKRSTVV